MSSGAAGAARAAAAAPAAAAAGGGPGAGRPAPGRGRWRSPWPCWSARLIGPWPTLLLIVGFSFAGLMVVRRGGARSARALRDASVARRLPGRRHGRRGDAAHRRDADDPAGVRPGRCSACCSSCRSPARSCGACPGCCCGSAGRPVRLGLSGGWPSGRSVARSSTTRASSVQDRTSTEPPGRAGSRTAAPSGDGAAVVPGPRRMSGGPGRASGAALVAGATLLGPQQLRRSSSRSSSSATERRSSSMSQWVRAGFAGRGAGRVASTSRASLPHLALPQGGDVGLEREGNLEHVALGAVVSAMCRSTGSTPARSPGSWPPRRVLAALLAHWAPPRRVVTSAPTERSGASQLFRRACGDAVKGPCPVPLPVVRGRRPHGR